MKVKKPGRESSGTRTRLVAFNNDRAESVNATPQPEHARSGARLEPDQADKYGFGGKAVAWLLRRTSTPIVWSGFGTPFTDGAMLRRNNL